MPLQQAFSGIMLAKQAAKGTPATTNVFSTGVTSGGTFDVQIQQSLVSATTGTRDFAYMNREAVKPAFSIQSPMYVKTCGLWLASALGTNTDSGAGPTYTHTGTSSATNTLPYLTVWGYVDPAAGQYMQISSAMVDSLDINFTQNGVVDMKAAGFGSGFLKTTIPTVTTDETKGTFFTLLGSSGIKFDTLTSTPVTARIMSGTIALQNQLSIIEDPSTVLPSDVFPGTRTATISLTIQPDDYTAWLAIVTNTTTGTGVSTVVPYGSVELNFAEYPAPVSNAATLKLQLPRVAWTVTSPVSDPNGGPADITLTGQILGGPAITAITTTLVNTLASW